jgi:hypothetical protein
MVALGPKGVVLTGAAGTASFPGPGGGGIDGPKGGRQGGGPQKGCREGVVQGRRRLPVSRWGGSCGCSVHGLLAVRLSARKMREIGRETWRDQCLWASDSSTGHSLESFKGSNGCWWL